MKSEREAMLQKSPRKSSKEKRSRSSEEKRKEEGKANRLGDQQLK